MKTIGLIGGTGWVSTLDYYRLINEGVNQRLGGLEAAKCILYSFNFREIYELNNAGDHDRILAMLTDAAIMLQNGGADCLLLCANTLHRYALQVQEKVNIPLIHIGDVTAKEIQKNGFSTVAVLGTRYTMEMDFYRSKLESYGITMMIPDQAERDFIHYAILSELVKDVFLPATRLRFIEIINRLTNEGAEGIVLGCTEIPLLISTGDVPATLFNTTMLHAAAAVEFALGN